MRKGVGGGSVERSIRPLDDKEVQEDGVEKTAPENKQEREQSIAEKAEQLIEDLDKRSPYINRASAKGYLDDCTRFLNGNAEKAISIIETFVGESGYQYLDTHISRRLDGLKFVFDSDDEIREVFFDCVDSFSPKAIVLIVDKIGCVGREISGAFFQTREKTWKDHPSSRWATMEEFLLDNLIVQEMARNRLVEKDLEETLLEMPEAEDEDFEVAVELEIPGMQYAPDWWSVDHTSYVRTRERGDDKDYVLPSELPRFDHTGSRAPGSKEYVHLIRAIKKGDTEAQLKSLEQIIGLGEIPEEKREVLLRSVEMMAKVWGFSEPEEHDGEVQRLRALLQEARSNSPLPESSNPLTIHHKTLDRTWTMGSFEDRLRARMLEPLVAGAVHYARRGKDDNSDLMEQLIKIEFEARKMYQRVVDTGIPLFKDFVSWLNEEARRTQEKGEEHPGEFYVGRDTFETLYPAAKSMRWGEMELSKVRKLTVYVNVSRPLIDWKEGRTPRVDNLEAVQQMKTIFKKWLEQEGVTANMFGIDGGFSGNGPTPVIKAFNESFSFDQISEKVRLVETSYSERRMRLRSDVDGFVHWMEHLPKFTDRSQKIVESPIGKLGVQTTEQTATERVFAWTVQHVVLRELINYEPEDRSQDTWTQPPTLNSGLDEDYDPFDDEPPPDDDEYGYQENQEVFDEGFFPKKIQTSTGETISLSETGGWTQRIEVCLEGYGTIGFAKLEILSSSQGGVEAFWKDIVDEVQKTRTEEEKDVLFESIRSITQKHFPDVYLSSWLDSKPEKVDLHLGMELPATSMSSTGREIILSRSRGWGETRTDIEIRGAGYVYFEDTLEMQLDKAKLETFWSQVKIESKLVETDNQLIEIIATLVKVHFPDALINKNIDGDQEDYNDDVEYGNYDDAYPDY